MDPHFTQNWVSLYFGTVEGKGKWNALYSVRRRRKPIGGVRVTNQHSIHSPNCWQHYHTSTTYFERVLFSMAVYICIAPIAEKSCTSSRFPPPAVLLLPCLGHVTCHNTVLSPSNSMPHFFDYFKIPPHCDCWKCILSLVWRGRCLLVWCPDPMSFLLSNLFTLVSTSVQSHV